MLPLFLLLRHMDDKAAKAHHEAIRSQEDHMAGLTRRMHELEDRYERLLNTCAAVWAVLRDKTGLTEDDLVRTARELGLVETQSSADQPKPPPPVIRCGGCGSAISLKLNRCEFCGEEGPRRDKDAFSQLQQ